MWNNTQDAGERHVRFLTLMKTCCSVQARCSLFNDIINGHLQGCFSIHLLVYLPLLPSHLRVEQRCNHQFSQNVLKVNLPKMCMYLVRIGWDERVLHTWSIVVSRVRIRAPGWRAQCPKQLVCPENIGWVNEWVKWLTKDWNSSLMAWNSLTPSSIFCV